MQYILGALVIVINLAVYGWVLFRRHHASAQRFHDSPS
jgi:hypothetical protein